MMKKYWRKMMALTCAAAMLFTMAGCGNAEGTTGGAETAQSSTTADGSGEITIQFAEHVADIQAQEPHLQKIITAFEESHPGIKIDITGKEVSEHNTQMTLLAGENKLPDVFWLEQATAKEFAQNGYLYDLTDALDQYGINDSLLPGLVHSCTCLLYTSSARGSSTDRGTSLYQRRAGGAGTDECGAFSEWSTPCWF